MRYRNGRWAEGAAAGLLIALTLFGCSTGPSPQTTAQTQPATSQLGPTGTPSTETPTSTADPTASCALIAKRQAHPEDPKLFDVVLTNSGNADCHLDGYIPAQLLDKSGNALGGFEEMNSVPETEVVVSPGKSAYVLFHLAGQAVYPDCAPIGAKILQLVVPNVPAVAVAVDDIGICGRGKDSVQEFRVAATPQRPAS